MARRLEGRNGSIYRAYILGTTQEELAQLHGLSQQHVSEIIRNVTASIPEEDLADRRKRVLDVLDVGAQVAAEVMDSKPSQAYSNGRPMVNDDGTPILDYGARLAGLDRLIKISERVSKVLGLDAAQRVDVDVSNQARDAASQAAADAVARMAARSGEATSE